MISVAAPVRIIDHVDHLNSVTISSNSPTRFGRGGRAKLAKLAISHHVPIRGRISWAPRIKMIVRLWVRS